MPQVEQLNFSSKEYFAFYYAGTVSMKGFLCVSSFSVDAGAFQTLPNLNKKK